ncbi:MAG: Gfo/Idh/MocA family oxidoreductase [Pseudomonadota bacterium]
MKRTALIGAGAISEVHAAALKARKDVVLAAIVDPVAARARQSADAWGVNLVHDNLETLIDGGDIDAAHVATPPDTHARVARALIEANIDVLIERPLAETGAECDALMDLAADKGVSLHVAQNYLFHPAHRRLRKALRANALGAVRHVTCVYAAPFPRPGAVQFGDWAYDSPLNLLLEQAAHPLSLIADCAGDILETKVTATQTHKAPDGTELVNAWDVSFVCALSGAQMRIHLGASYPVWRLFVACDDGAAEVDYLKNLCVLSKPGTAPRAASALSSGLASAGSVLAQSAGGLAASAVSLMKPPLRRGAFYTSVKGGVDEFYDGLAARKRIDGAAGTALVKTCEQIAAQTDFEPISRFKPVTPAQNAKYDVAVLGGTGFIGRSVVGKLLADGKRVAVFARNVRGLPEMFDSPNVGVFKGSIADKEALQNVLARAPHVINLAHGGADGGWEDVRDAVIGGAVKVAEAAAAADVKQLIFVSSIAALYLGDPDAVVTADTPADNSGEMRSHEARAKAEAEREMMRFHRDKGLAVTIMRPGVVVGGGGTPFPGALGVFNTETHCLGWNHGRNALPFVLVDDVADGLVAALGAQASYGKAYNLVGDVRLSAREYIAELGKALGRPLRYHSRPFWLQRAGEGAAWLVKRAARRTVPFPSPLDLKSRGLTAQFDTRKEKQDLGWAPVADRKIFVARAITVQKTDV